ncbi:MAG: two-component regulator propeller domain-containing protein [Mangrovibacterium sp.]
MNLQKLSISILIVICSFCANAQSLYFHHLTIKDGLPHNKINSIVEDKYGFIWIACAGMMAIR